MTDAVGIALLDGPPVGLERTASRATHCAFAGRARRGEAFWASSDDIACRAARYVLGCDGGAGALETAAAAFVESKLFTTRDAAMAFVSGFRILAPGPRVFAYFPLSSAPVPADVVVWFVRPEDAMLRLRALLAATGERAEAWTGGAAALCHDSTAFPLVTGRAALSCGCPGSRRDVPLGADEALVAIPGRLATLARLS